MEIRAWYAPVFDLDSLQSAMLAHAQLFWATYCMPIESTELDDEEEY